MLFNRTKTAQMEVSAHHWERSVAVEQFKNVQEQKWRNEAAADASGMTCIQKQRSTTKRQVGEDCHTEKVDKKDGTFEQLKKCSPHYVEDPVMDDWCTYNVDRWTKIDEIKNTGTDMNPAWPANVPPADVSSPAIGAKRQGARTEKLYVDFGKKGTCDVSESMWRKLSDGQKVKIEVRARSGNLVCDTIQPK